MRKRDMAAVIDGLKKHNDLLRAERDEARNVVAEGLAKTRNAVASVKADVAGLHEKADAAAVNLRKHGEDLAGLAEAVRASLLAHAEKAEPEPAGATPIRRGSKAAD